MRDLLVLACSAALAALFGCGKSEAGPDAASGGSSSNAAGESPAGNQAGASTSGAGNGATAGGRMVASRAVQPTAATRPLPVAQQAVRAIAVAR
ncbi:MAG TPA: hypothetical protein VIW29_09100, partial [Polyangiaceae bacterium]